MIKCANLSPAIALACLLGAVAVISPATGQVVTTYPDATNTGVPVGVALTVVSGNMTITTNGTIVENKDIRGCVTVSADNVIIRKSKVSCGGISVIYNNGTNLLVEDAEIVCTGSAGTVLTPANYTARRVNAHGCENIMWAESNVLIEDSFLHDPIPYNSTTDPHTDSIQVPQGGRDITIRHNRIYGGYDGGTNFGNSAVGTGGGVANFLLEDNVLAGGGYTARCAENGVATSNYRVINNRFSRIFISTVGGFGPQNMCDEMATQYSGNVYHETGQLLPGQAALQTPAAPTMVTAL